MPNTCSTQPYDAQLSERENEIETEREKEGEKKRE